ncbi:MAG: PEP/pyruvate-binding domain-containing protein [Candidatus Sulfobium sp.]|jgi:phosphoglucan,water dikinase
MGEKKGFRIGNQTAWFAGSITEPFEYAVANGFDAFEWFPDRKESGEGWSEGDLGEETRVYIKDTAAAHDIRLSVHVPWRWSPFTQGSEVEMERALSLARDIGAVVMNIHFYKEKGAAAFAEAVRPVINELSDKGISLSIENTTETTPDDFNELFRLLGHDTGGKPSAGMCLDLGHANICRATRNDYLRYIDLLDGDLPIIHAHLHENYGDSDRHLPLFTGPSAKDDSGIRGLIDRLKKRRFSGSLILEQWPDPPRLIDEARNRLLSIIGVSPKATAAPKPEIPGGDFARVIALADRKRKSWREKLSWVHDLFSNGAPDLTREQLVYLAIYLRFLGTGQVKVTEDGSHYRPSHHARMAKDIFGRLARMETPENSFIIRKIYPWLPSFDSDFLRAEPLTRIRDIAHRNDIPQELKREIKATLQNKLHRNAGPEDLETSSRLLERITSPGADYPSSFIGEFRKFHEELKEFFNARSLDEQLEAVARISGEEEAGIIHRFLDAKASAKDSEGLTEAFELLTRLRELFAVRRRGRDDSEAQQLTAADTGMEDFSFVLVSRIFGDLRSHKAVPWERALRCLGLTVENLRIGGFDREECRAIVSELEAWRQGFDDSSRYRLLRLKATVDRSLRLSEAYTQTVMSLFPERAERLGHALGVDQRAVRVFTESEIRGHPVFQLSKLAGFLLKVVRQRAALPPWDVIVPGKVSGRLRPAPGLSGLSRARDRSVIALLEKVEGDEEIPAVVAAIVVPHETPHLSHLAVRARQAGVVFAGCEDEEVFSGLRDLKGKTITFDARGENVRYTVSGGRTNDAKRRSPAAHVELPAVETPGGKGLLERDGITLESCGGKAFGARRLLELSSGSGAGFTTPKSAAIPFGVMEECLKKSPELGREYRSLIGRLDNAGAAETDDILARMRKIMAVTKTPDGLLPAVGKTFGPGKRLMVRSSSNCEDLEGLSGAGLYESVANVSAEGIGDAVRSVWASLWTKRAVMNRAQLGVPHGDAHMAVLVQEMRVPDYAFIIHTVNPVTGERDEVYIELAAGLGEVLASGRLPGTPYRMVCSRHAAGARMLSFASFSQAFLPGPDGGITREVMDYSRTRFSTDEKFRKDMGKRLTNIAVYVEERLGKPQDIEGIISGEEICLVQSRPQQGIP